MDYRAAFLLSLENLQTNCDFSSPTLKQYISIWNTLYQLPKQFLLWHQFRIRATWSPEIRPRRSHYAVSQRTSAERRKQNNLHKLLYIAFKTVHYAAVMVSSEMSGGLLNYCNKNRNYFRGNLILSVSDFSKCFCPRAVIRTDSFPPFASRSIKTCARRSMKVHPRGFQRFSGIKCASRVR